MSHCLFKIAQRLVGEADVTVGPALLGRVGELLRDTQVHLVVPQGGGVLAHLLVHRP